MNQKPPKCSNCGLEMFEMGCLQKPPDDNLQVLMEGYKFRDERKIYQCPEDKTIAID